MHPSIVFILTWTKWHEFENADSADVHRMLNLFNGCFLDKNIELEWLLWRLEITIMTSQSRVALAFHADAHFFTDIARKATAHSNKVNKAARSSGTARSSGAPPNSAHAFNSAARNQPEICPKSARNLPEICPNLLTFLAIDTQKKIRDPRVACPRPQPAAKTFRQ